MDRLTACPAAPIKTRRVEGFALASGREETTGRSTELMLPGDTTQLIALPDSYLLVTPDVAHAQRAQETAAREAEKRGQSSSGSDLSRAGGEGTVSGTDATGASGSTPDENGRGTRGAWDGGPEDAGWWVWLSHPRSGRRAGAVLRLRSRFGTLRRDFAKVGQEILQHLAAATGTRLEVTVEIHATNAEGFTLRFEQHGFETS